MTSSRAIVAAAAGTVLAIAGCSAGPASDANESPTSTVTSTAEVDDDAVPSQLTRETLEATTELTRGGIDPATGLDHRAVELFTELGAEQRGTSTVISLPESALFDAGEEDIRPDAADLLARLVELAELTGDARVTIAAPASNVTSGEDVASGDVESGDDDAEPAVDHGVARAITLGAALVALGIDAGRIIIPSGSSESAAPDDDGDNAAGAQGRLQVTFEGVTITGIPTGP